MTSPHSHLLSPTTRGLPSPASRRQHVGQPPTLLTTALSTAHNQSVGASFGSQQPQSTTSLSAPFSPYQYSAYSPSASAETGESSPMATRTQSNFNTPYNPQQWGPLSSTTSSPLDVATRSRQSSHTSRFPRFAARQAGPDGM